MVSLSNHQPNGGRRWREGLRLWAKQGGTTEHYGCRFAPDEASNRFSLEASMASRWLEIRCNFIFPGRDRRLQEQIFITYREGAQKCCKGYMN
jgi:hypothetical protein